MILFSAADSASMSSRSSAVTNVLTSSWLICALRSFSRRRASANSSSEGASGREWNMCTSAEADSRAASALASSSP